MGQFLVLSRIFAGFFSLEIWSLVNRHSHSEAQTQISTQKTAT
jgi:hypothetical protein